ncbi:2Fe-2S iron-sulfur cluster-binding protein [Brevibacillus nitrificans]|uniref:(2Fe-2S)-binding protein n=1 Tax=Brevibacillus nitrificans TaxID=651560 RepID=UPI00285B309E|nr:2Fe-2S iron-sulfur cluster-binding protein [Brevibacillus nitrificans]MDR7316441.1 carbon-monoxide dehydrogenase small subunit [Brevibacillus nitrificans]
MSTDLIELHFTLNGERKTIEVKPYHTLAQVLRDQLDLTGTKLCCEEGECGACTVILNEKAVTSCIVLAPEINGCELKTIEGLVQDGELDPVQEAFIEKGAVQCGYCIPGMIMSAKALLQENNDPCEADIREALAGNLCRCAGYYRIIDAVTSAGKQIRDAIAAKS